MYLWDSLAPDHGELFSIVQNGNLIKTRVTALCHLLQHRIEMSLCTTSVFFFYFRYHIITLREEETVTEEER